MKDNTTTISVSMTTNGEMEIKGALVRDRENTWMLKVCIWPISGALILPFILPFVLYEYPTE